MRSLCKWHHFPAIPSSLIFASYVQILLTVLQMKPSEAWKKSFSTCFFHMIVVIMYCGPFIFIYMRPKKYHTPGQDTFLAIFYTIFTPSFNPIIYSFRKKDVLEALKNMLNSNFVQKNNRKNAWNTFSLFPQLYLDDICYSYLWKDNKKIIISLTVERSRCFKDPDNDKFYHRYLPYKYIYLKNIPSFLQYKL